MGLSLVRVVFTKSSHTIFFPTLAPEMSWNVLGKTSENLNTGGEYVAVTRSGFFVAFEFPS